VVAELDADSLDEQHALAAMAQEAGAAPAARDSAVGGRVAAVDAVLVLENVAGSGVHSVDLQVGRGEVVGLAAVPHAAASELLQIVFGAAPMREGTVRVAGASPGRHGVRDAMHAGVAYVPGDRATATFGDMTIAENLSAASVRTYWRHGRLYRRRERADARRVIGDWSIAASAPEQLLRTLSGGNQQKVLLARWLRRGPEVLLLDEPTRGVDVGTRREIAGAVRDAADAGAGVLLASDDYDELAAVADRVVVLVDGRVVGQLAGPVDAVDVARLAASTPTYA